MPRQNAHPVGILLMLLLVGPVIGCTSIYYGTMEKLGFEKRDILVDRVGDARQAQQDAKEQFESALEQFLAVTDYQGGELEQQYRELNAEFDDSEAEAAEVRERIDRVEQVAGDLFAEWESELQQYTDPALRRSSARQLRETRSRYGELIKVMQRAESRMDPVLAAFRDRVLFLKHNLNARAIASLREERSRIESDVASLIKEMNRSIAEADQFMESMSARE